MKILARFLLSIAVTCLVVGCKLAVMVSPGGNVYSDSGTRNCVGPDFCEFDITDPFFSETFTAVPRPGFTFEKWQGGDGFVCANSTDPVCTLTLSGGVLGNAVVDSGLTGSVRPLFSGPSDLDSDGDGVVNMLDDDDDDDGYPDIGDQCPLDGPDWDGFGCPYIPEHLTVLLSDGKRWAQPELFDWANWHDVNAVCPAPAGICFGKLGDYDVTGWVWASGGAVTSLLNAFLGTSLSAVPDWTSVPDVPEWTAFSPNIFNYFFAEDNGGGPRLWGWHRDQANIVEAYPYGLSCQVMADDDCYYLYAGSYDRGVPSPMTLDLGGAWLYRVE
jgi:hypothetical protein